MMFLQNQALTCSELLFEYAPKAVSWQRRKTAGIRGLAPGAIPDGATRICYGGGSSRSTCGADGETHGREAGTTAPIRLFCGFLDPKKRQVLDPAAMPFLVRRDHLQRTAVHRKRRTVQGVGHEKLRVIKFGKRKYSREPVRAFGMQIFRDVRAFEVLLQRHARTAQQLGEIDPS
jgi:hypothetical protein